MPDNTLNKLYHWRYGPLTITSMIGTTFVTIVDDPDGIVRGDKNSWKSFIEMSPKKFEGDKLGVYVFTNPMEVDHAPHYNPNLLHKFYSENPKDKQLQELNDLRTRLSAISDSSLLKKGDYQLLPNN